MKTKKVESSLFSPIKIKLDGREYEIPKVPYKTLKKLQSDKFDADVQLSKLTGLSIDVIGEFDAREIAYALRKIVRELMSPFLFTEEKKEIQGDQEKNGSKTSEKS